MARKMTIENMRAAVEAHDANVLAQKQAASEAYLALLVELVDSDEFKALALKVDELVAQYEDDHSIAVHLHCLATAMPNLTGELERRSNGATL